MRVVKNKVVWHQVFLFGGLIFLLLLRWVTGRFIFDVGVFWWLIGAIIGFVLVFADRLAYIFLMKEEPLSVKVGEMTARGNWRLALSTLLEERREQKQLVIRSALFVMVWMVLALFTATSSANDFARGLMLGLGMHLVFDMVTDYLWEKEKLDLWFWQIKREIPKDEKQMFVGIVVLVFLFLANIL